MPASLAVNLGREEGFVVRAGSGAPLALGGRGICGSDRDDAMTPPPLGGGSGISTSSFLAYFAGCLLALCGGGRLPLPLPPCLQLSAGRSG